MSTQDTKPGTTSKATPKRRDVNATAPKAPPARKPKPATAKAPITATTSVATGTTATSVATGTTALTNPDAEMRKRELIDKVVLRSGIKKKYAKPVVEAMLAELGDALTQGRDMVLPPLGKLKINRSKPLANGHMSIVKVRQKKPVIKV
jgi:DNA-binding protein HU-alpha